MSTQLPRLLRFNKGQHDFALHNHYGLPMNGKEEGYERERERQREIHYVHSTSLAYEDGIVFKSEPSAARQ